MKSWIKNLFVNSYGQVRVWWVMLLIASVIITAFTFLVTWADSNDRENKRDECRDIAKVVGTEWHLDNNTVCWLKVDDRWAKV